MRLGLFSDLHSNRYALEAMFAVAGEVDAWFSLGDAVGLFPGVNEVLDAFRTLGVGGVAGDHERCLMSGEPLAGSVSGTQSLELQRAALSATNMAYLRDLVESADVTLGGRRIAMIHELPAPRGEGSGKYAVDLASVEASFPKADVVAFGHTHLPLVSWCKGLLLVNPGSAGFPVDVTAKPSFALLDTEDLGCEMRHFDYDTRPLVADVERLGYNSALARYLRAKRWVG